MQTVKRNGLRLAAVMGAGVMLLAACGGSSSSSSEGSSAASGATGGDAPTKGGTVNVLTLSEQFNHLDPQRNYTGVDLAFASAYLNRTLTQYKLAPGPDGVTLVPDMATDTGTANADATSWSFTLRDGVSFQDGTPIGCSDIKYGVSRTFATDVITDGPTYAISYLDIPQNDDGTSTYKGPYVDDAAGQANFDKAVTCSDDNKTITFNLNQPVGDFNYAVTLSAFSPVPKGSDTGEKYDDAVVSSGPYQITEYTKGQKLVLDRNPNWDEASDPIRKAWPDKVVVSFAIDASAIDQRIIADAGEDQTAVPIAGMQPENLATVFASDDPRFADRSVDAADPYARYMVINTQKVPNLKQREAIAVAVNRAEILQLRGGDFAGTLADGVISPTLGAAYQPSDMWTSAFGQPIPDTGDPEYAKQLITESGEPMPKLIFQFPNNPLDEKIAVSTQASLAKAGIEVELAPLEPGEYYSIVMDPTKAEGLIRSGWAADWPNASTVIPPLFGQNESFNLGFAGDQSYWDSIATAKANTDPASQATQWADLNKQAMSQAWVVPQVFGKTQYIWGSKIGGSFMWDAYGAIPYANLWVKQ